MDKSKEVGFIEKVLVYTICVGITILILRREQIFAIFG